MHWIRNILRQVFGLFVDDGRFAAAVLAWLAVVRLVLFRFTIIRNTRGIILFVGLGFILIESTVRYSRSNRLSAGK